MQKLHPFVWRKPCGVAPRVFPDRRRDSNLTLLRHDSGPGYTEEPMIRSKNWKRKTSGLLIVVFHPWLPLDGGLGPDHRGEYGDRIRERTRGSSVDCRKRGFVSKERNRY